MPLTKKGKKIMTAMKSQYGSEKGERVFYASVNKGTISGVHAESVADDLIQSVLDGLPVDEIIGSVNPPPWHPGTKTLKCGTCRSPLYKTGDPKLFKCKKCGTNTKVHGIAWNERGLEADESQ